MIAATMNKKFVWILAALGLCLGSCGRNAGYVGFRDIRQIKPAPEEVTVLGPGEGRRLETGAAASAVDLIVRDSLLIFSRFGHECSVAAVQKETLEPRGAFIRTGRAFGEVSDLVPLGEVSTVRTDGDYRMGYRDAGGKWVIVALLRSLSEGSPQVCQTVSLPEDFRNVFQKVYLGSGQFLGENLNGRQSAYERSIRGEGPEKKITPAMETLNMAEVDPDRAVMAFNLLGTVFGYEPQRKRVVEASTCMNTIHLYDVDGDFARTLYLGERPDDLDAVQQAYAETGDISALFKASCVRAYPDFFAVMYYDGVLLFFDWSGKLLRAFRLEVPAARFDIDLADGHLYALDNAAESVWCFDIS